VSHSRAAAGRAAQRDSPFAGWRFPLVPLGISPSSGGAAGWDPCHSSPTRRRDQPSTPRLGRPGEAVGSSPSTAELWASTFPLLASLAWRPRFLGSSTPPPPNGDTVEQLLPSTFVLTAAARWRRGASHSAPRAGHRTACHCDVVVCAARRPPRCLPHAGGGAILGSSAHRYRAHLSRCRPPAALMVVASPCDSSAGATTEPRWGAVTAGGAACVRARVVQLVCVCVDAIVAAGLFGRPPRRRPCASASAYPAAGSCLLAVRGLPGRTCISGMHSTGSEGRGGPSVYDNRYGRGTGAGMADVLRSTSSAPPAAPPTSRRHLLRGGGAFCRAPTDLGPAGGAASLGMPPSPSSQHHGWASLPPVEQLERDVGVGGRAVEDVPGAAGSTMAASTYGASHEHLQSGGSRHRPQFPPLFFQEPQLNTPMWRGEASWQGVAHAPGGGTGASRDGRAHSAGPIHAWRSSHATLDASEERVGQSQHSAGRPPVRELSTKAAWAHSGSSLFAAEQRRSSPGMLAKAHLQHDEIGSAILSPLATDDRVPLADALTSRPYPRPADGASCLSRYSHASLSLIDFSTISCATFPRLVVCVSIGLRCLSRLRVPRLLRPTDVLAAWL